MECSDSLIINKIQFFEIDLSFPRRQPHASLLRLTQNNYSNIHAHVKYKR